MNTGIKLFLMVSLATVMLAGTANAADQVTLYLPPDGQNISSTTPTFYFNGSFDYGTLSNCTIRINITGSSLEDVQVNTSIVNASNSSTKLDASNALSDNRAYKWNVVCTNNTGTNVTAGSDFTFRLNTARPTLPNLGPSGTVTSTTPTLVATSSEAADCKYDTVSGNVYANMSYGFSTGNGTTSHSTVLGPLSWGSSYTYYVACADVLGNASNVSSTSFTVAGASGGLPPKVILPERISQANSMGAASAGDAVSLRYTFDIVAVTKIDFTLANDVVNLKIEVKSLGSSLPSGLTTPSGTVYKYIDITPTNVVDADLSDGATITFKVTKTWHTNNGIEPGTTKLQRWTGSVWEQLTTTQTDSDDTYYYFEAETPGFSRFAITAGIVTLPPTGCTEGETRSCTTAENCPGTQTCTAGAWGACADVPDDGCPTEEEQPTPAGINYMWIVAIVVVLIIIAVIAMSARKK